ncbi:MAG: hypothetical protein KatS3mg038_2050 [Candidatus Kapaibacterium sp.]|nr:MAG: hypothetical protein KatS3mg038_2050 [Candidatus Kapabacteria bacterium]
MDSRLNEVTNAWTAWRWRAALLGITPEQIARSGLRWFLAIMNDAEHDRINVPNQQPRALTEPEMKR